MKSKQKEAIRGAVSRPPEKNMIKRIIALLLSVAALLFGFASCAEQTQTAAETTEVTETTDQAETTYPRPYIPKTDLGGETFMICYPGWGQYNDYFFADELSGEQMNDAIYQRSARVEEYLGIVIDKYTPGYIQHIMPAVQASVMSGTDDYQLVLTHCIQDLGNMMISGLLLNWNTVPYISWDPVYWNETMNETVSVYGRLYYAVSSYMIADPNAFLFNKQMINENRLENPYQIVRDGKWTIDTLYNMVKAVSSDVDGDGRFTVNDIYGLAAESDWMLISFMYGSDQFMVKRDEAGQVVLAMYNDKMLTLTQKLYDLFHGGNHTYLWPYGAAAEQTILIDSGRCLFSIIPLHSSKNYRQSEVDFGILPFPKFDEAQKNYITNDWGGFMCIPSNTQKSEMIGMTCELLAYESLTTTMPAYYDVLLTGKVARDDDSIEMLDIIFSNIVYDMGMNFFGFDTGFNQLFYMIPQMIGNGKSTDLASLYNRNEKAAQKIMDRLFEKMQELQ